MSTTRDEYLFSAACAPPAQDITIDPQFGNVRITTPIGRLSYVTLVKPRSPAVGQDPKFSCTLLMAPDYVGDLWRAIAMVADRRWPSEQRPNPANPSEMVMMSGSQMLQHLKFEHGGLRNPLRHGDELFMKEPSKHEAYRGLIVVNAGVAAVSKKTGQSQQPFVLDEDGHPMDPGKVYSGCYGRMQVTIFAYPQQGTQAVAGNRGIGVLLNAVQFARHGEKLGGFDGLKAAQNAFGALPKAADAPVGVPGAAAGGNPWMGTAPATPAAPPAAPGGFAAPGGGVQWGAPPG